MKVYLGIDLGSTTTKAVLLDEGGQVIGRGITNSRSNYHLAADIARDEALIGARFSLIGKELAKVPGGAGAKLEKRLYSAFRREQQLSQWGRLQAEAENEAQNPRFGSARPALVSRIDDMFAELVDRVKRPRLTAEKRSDFFRDQASSDWSRLAEQKADREVSFDDLMSVFDKAIIAVENERMDLTFEGKIRAALASATSSETEETAALYRDLVLQAAETPLDVAGSIGTGYGRQRLPFPRESIRSEILCHGLGAHAMFPGTRTVLDIGGQDTKAIQVDSAGIVTNFQMNDRCAAGCGRYLGYIADEMNLGLHELGPLAMGAGRKVKINSTCTVFAGAELRDRLSMGERREDILAGLHRSIILRAMALLARSGGVNDEMTFTGGVASNVAAVSALKDLVTENYGERVLNISPSSIYTGAFGASLFALRAAA